MKKFEYVSYEGYASQENMIVQNRYGADGWELVAVVLDPQNSAGACRFYFKRELQPKGLIDSFKSKL